MKNGRPERIKLFISRLVESKIAMKNRVKGEKTKI
jgi:hypothetical protein